MIDSNIYENNYFLSLKKNPPTRGGASLVKQSDASRCSLTTIASAEEEEYIQSLYIKDKDLRKYELDINPLSDYEMSIKSNKRLEEDFLEEFGYPVFFASDEEVGTFEEEKILNSYRYYVRKQGQLVEFKKVPREDKSLSSLYTFQGLADWGEHLGGGGVGSVMSDKSKWSLKRLALSLDTSKINLNGAFFMTLTFPFGGDDIRPFQRCAKMFFEYLKRSLGFSIIWKKEYQKNGAPHFHCLLLHDNSFILGNYFTKKSCWGDDYIAFTRKAGRPLKKGTGFKGFRFFIQKKWAYYVKNNVNWSLKNFPNVRYFSNGITATGFHYISDETLQNVINSATDVCRLEGLEGIATYLTDYFLKDGHQTKAFSNVVPDDVNNGGRWWGKINLDKFISESESIEVSPINYLELQDLLKTRSYEISQLDYDLNPYRVEKVKGKEFKKEKKKPHKRVLDFSCFQIDSKKYAGALRKEFDNTIREYIYTEKGIDYYSADSFEIKSFELGIKYFRKVRENILFFKDIFYNKNTTNLNEKLEYFDFVDSLENTNRFFKYRNLDEELKKIIRLGVCQSDKLSLKSIMCKCQTLAKYHLIEKK